MPAIKRIKTKYPGVYYVESGLLAGKKERTYYVRYRKNGTSIEEKVGHQF